MGVPGTAHTALPRFGGLPEPSAQLEGRAAGMRRSTAYLDNVRELSAHSAVAYRPRHTGTQESSTRGACNQRHSSGSPPSAGRRAPLA